MSRPGEARARRVRVTSPRTGAPRRGTPRSGAHEIDEQTTIGAMYMDSLMRAQLRLSIRVIAVVLGGLGVLPLLFALVPFARTFAVFGVPLPWVVLGVLAYPVLFLAARYYVSRAERIEASFADLVVRQ